MDLLPLQRKLCCGILSLLKNPSPSAGYETMNLGFNGKHANPYNTEDDGNVYQWKLF
jgi:hypothetical protein